jgi:hypothetical protein
MSGQSSEPDKAERESLRAFRRVPLGRTVRVYCDDWDVPVDLQSNDISRGGLFLVTDSPPRLHAEITLAFDAHDAQSLRIKAMVTHIISPERGWFERRRPGFGALFQYVTDEQRARIEAVLAEAAAQAANRELRETLQSSVSPKEPPAVDPSLAPLYADLTANLVRMKEADPAAVLRLAPDADAAAAESAMLALSKTYHPHKYARHASPAIDQLATQIFVLIQKAHAAFVAGLATPGAQPPRTQERRASAEPPARSVGSGRAEPTRRVSSIEPGRVTVTGRPSQRTAPAPDSAVYNALRELAARGAAHGEAAAGSGGPQRRVSGRPETPLDDALRLIARGRLPEAEKMLEDLVSSGARSRTAEIWLRVVQARLRKLESKMDEAIAIYQRVLELQPSHREAIEEIRLHNQARRRNPRLVPAQPPFRPSDAGKKLGG